MTPTPAQFVSTVLSFFKENKRSFPWRKKTPSSRVSAYKILVSEIMLQQTRTDRVEQKFKEFLREFPTLFALADATPREVLVVWKGLGYNTRALSLLNASRTIQKEFGGRIPKDPKKLASLKGVGEYTAKAVSTFAYNEPHIFIETNIRSAFTHHFFKKSSAVPDSKLAPLMEKCLLVATNRKIPPRDWYAALMDYGAHLKKSGVLINHKNCLYKKQSPFQGSNREVRSKITTLLLKVASMDEKQLERKVNDPRTKKALTTLLKDGVIQKKNSHYYI